MPLIDEVKTALRVSTDEPDIVGQIGRMIEEAKLDLIHTADIRADLVNANEPDALIKGAVICYCAKTWTDDADEAARYAKSYADYKAKLSMSAAYTDY